MPLKDQRPSGIGWGPVSADHGARLGEIMLDRSEAAQVLQVVEVDMPVVDLVAALAQEIADHILAWSLRAAGGGNCDKIPCRLQLGVEPGVNRVENPLPVIPSTHCGSRTGCCV